MFPSVLDCGNCLYRLDAPVKSKEALTCRRSSASTWRNRFTCRFPGRGFLRRATSRLNLPCVRHREIRRPTFSIDGVRRRRGSSVCYSWIGFAGLDPMALSWKSTLPGAKLRGLCVVPDSRAGRLFPKPGLPVCPTRPDPEDLCCRAPVELSRD
jgi:hypothetical protein